MNKKIALLFSGQGAQSAGMGRDLAAQYSEAAELFQKADAGLGRGLTAIMFEGPDEALTRTGNCQPALFVHGLACLAALRAEVGDFPVVAAAGLSLGEFTAHTAAGTFDFETGLRLVEHRGQYMDEACDATNGAMAAMIGAEENLVRDLAGETGVDVANLNAPGQVVVSGEATRVALAVGLAKERGVRKAMMLNVAGAYHSRLMNPAYLKLGEELKTVPIGEPRFPVLCNVDGRPVSGADEIRRTLTDQVTSTVRWADCMEYMLGEFGCDLFLELGPGGVLAGLLQRIRKGTEVISISNAASVSAAAAKLRAAL